ncbi:MAG: M16 family metallopeptidase [Limisphaerales bacterium]
MTAKLSVGMARGVAAWLLVVALPAAAQQVPVTEHTLPNGLRVLLVERQDDPSIAAGWVARVGSANERPGITGLAHFFEHMMFKGTPTIGTKDAARDLEIIAEQERVREEMRREEAALRAAWRRGEISDPFKPEHATPRYRELEKEFAKLVQAQRDLIVPNEFDKIYRNAGAVGMNAYTSQDLTAYFITVPANKLELWMWMESERILRPVFREFYAERDVVAEERRLRIEATPTGKFQEALFALVWESHPYHWPIIGWPSDLPTLSLAQAQEFYATYYAPQNLTLVLVGQFNTADTLPQIEKYFGRIPRGPRDVPEVVTLEVPAVAEKRMNAEADTNPEVQILWKTVGFGHRDSYPLQILGQVLSTRTGRLYKGLVLDERLATEAEAGQASFKYAGLFYIGAEVAEGRAPAEVEAAIYRELDRLRDEPVPERELQKVKNNFAAAEYRKLTSNMAILHQLLRAEGSGRWQEINEAGPKLQAVTAADLQRVVRTYFTRENRTVCTYTRKPGPAVPEDPALAGLNAEQRQMVQQAVAGLAKATDAAKVRAGLGRLEAQLDSAPPEMKSVLTVIRQKMADRLAELEAARN